MKRIVAAGLAAVFVIIAGVVVAEPGWGPGAGPGNCNGCGRGPGQGMGGAGRMYDPAKVEVVAGQVVSLDQIEGRRGPGTGVVLTMKTGSETLSVHLGPQWFMDKQDMKLAAGDSVEIKGAKSTRRGENVFLAAEVKKGGAVLKLRDENGVPVWAGWRRGENKS
jgi:hypothetical protein